MHAEVAVSVMEGVMKVLAAMSALILTCAPAAAGPIVDAAARAEALQAEGKTIEALDALNEAEAALWEASPIAFRNVTLVDSFEGYGEYEKSADAAFEPDEKATVYVEPVGFGYGGSTEQPSVDFSFDFAIENTTGQIIAEGRDAFTFSNEVRPNRRDVGIGLTFTVPYVRPGEYKAVFTVRDQNSEKTSAFEVPFTVTEP